MDNNVNGASGVYQIQNIVNGKRYIGSAVNIKQRWSEHRSMLTRGVHHSKHLQNSHDKHGEHKFTYSVILYCDPSMLIQLEQYYFFLYQPEYNVAPIAGSTLGIKHTAETKDKIRKKRTGSVGMRGKKHPLYGLRGNKNHNYGSKSPLSKPVAQIDPKTGGVIATFSCASEVQENTGIPVHVVRDSANGKSKLGSGYYWCYLDKIDSFSLSKMRDRKCKPVEQLDIDTGEVLAVYNSITEAAMAVNRDRNSIGACLYGKIKTCGGYKWRYAHGSVDDTR